MHILYIHQYFDFPEGSGGTRSYDLAKSFVDKGYEVTIITSNVHNNDNKRGWVYIRRDGINIYSVNCPYDNNMGFYQRIFSFLSFIVKASYKVCKIKTDIVLATSTPLTIAFPALLKNFINRTPFIFEVRDVWPEVPIKMGFIKNKLLIKLLYYFEKLTYKKAFAIVPLSTGMYKNITSRIPNLKDKMTIIPNISELDRFANTSKKVTFPFDIKEKRILIYCGTLGTVNGLSYLVDLAERTIDIDSNIVYCVVGKGRELDDILKLAKKKNVLNENFFYMGVVSKQHLPYLYHIATVGSSFVINNPILWDNSANKFFDTLAAHKPIIINHEGWQAETIREKKCGLVLPPQLDDESIAEFVSFMKNDNLLSEYGKNAYNLAKEEFSLKVAVDNYIKIFNKIQ